MTRTSPLYLIVARIIRPHGVRGDLRIQALTQFPERLSRLDSVYLGRDPEDYAGLAQYEVTRVRHDKADLWLLHLQGIEDRDLAEPLRGQYVLVSLQDAVPLEADEVYLFQVMGLEARTVEGQTLGRVEAIIETGANDVYVVRGEEYGEVLLPAIDSVIVNIDVESGVMLVRLLPGLLPE